MGSRGKAGRSNITTPRLNRKECNKKDEVIRSLDSYKEKMSVRDQKLIVSVCVRNCVNKEREHAVVKEMIE